MFVCVCMCIYDVYFQVTTAESKTALKLSNHSPQKTHVSNIFQQKVMRCHEFNEPMEFEESREPTAQRASNDSIPSWRIVNI